MATALGLGTIVIALAVGIGSIGSGLLPGLGVVPGAVSDAPSPSASPDVAQTEQEPGPEAFFTGALLSQGTDVKLMEMSEGDGVEHVRGVRFIERHEWSDPRLPMDSQAILNWDVYEAGVAVSNAVLFEGPDGYWMGTATTFCDHEDNCRGMTLLTGHEAYEGLTALIAGGSEAGGPGSLPTWDSEGFIFEGEMPPFPEPLEPAAK